MKIIDALNRAGIPAYLPGRAPAECRSAHCVVSDGGRSREGRTTGRRIFLLSVYVPEQRPGELPVIMRRVPEALVSLRDVRETGDTSPMMFDDEKKACVGTIEMYALCAI